MFIHTRLCYDVFVFIKTITKKRGIGMSDFNQNNDDEDIVVTLDLDDGSQVECEILTIFTVGERDYIALLPLDDDIFLHFPAGSGQNVYKTALSC